MSRTRITWTWLVLLCIAAVAFGLSSDTRASLDATHDEIEVELNRIERQRSTDTAHPQGPILRLRVAAFDPLRSIPPTPPILQRSLVTTQQALRLVQFPGPVQDAWYDEMIRSGLEIVTYIPDYAYLVWGTGNAVYRLSGAAPVRWTGDYQAAYALHPSLQRTTESDLDTDIVVQIYQHDGAASTLDVIRERSNRVLRPALTIRNLTTIGVEVAVSDLANLAKLPDVVSIEPLLIPEPLDEIQGQLVAGQVTPDGAQPSGPGYLHWLTATVGFSTTSTTYPIVDVTDDGIDDGDATPQHPDFFEYGDTSRPDRLIYNVNWTSDATADGVGGHGNLNASVVGGYNVLIGFPYEDVAGYNYGLGINPFGRIAGSKVFGNYSGWDAPHYMVLVGNSYALGARIISNSWGEQPGTGEYLVDDQIYDALVRDADTSIPGEQPVTIIFSAGNSGTYGAGTIGSPANAKNVISVGASENYRPTWTDGCGFGPTAADSANDIASFSSRGPTDDGRLKPELVAPGTHIQGAATQIAAYTGNYVCDKYHPSGQTLYAASSGTSHSAPAVAGAASLLTYFYQERLGTVPPSPAMVKAYLVNSARYLTGVGAGDTLPSNQQGYGALDLGLAFADIPRIAADQQTVLQHATGESMIIHGMVALSDLPFRVTLAWSDPPGPTVGDAYVNNLDLLVSVAGGTYRGNVFSGSGSVAGGSADLRNNVESIFLPAGVQGSFTITVAATNLAGDGVLYNGDSTDQDFALVCTNCQRSATFSLTATPLSQAICQPDTAVYTVTTVAFAGFSSPLLLDVSGQPTGSTASFVPNPVTAGAESLLSIGQTASTTAGAYALDVTASSPTLANTVTLGLDLFATPPNSPTLVSPTDGASGQSLRPMLSWDTIPQAMLYSVEVATSTAFAPVIYSASTPEISHLVTRTLEVNTHYVWRVTADNVCGPSSPSEAFSFTTQTDPFPFCSEPDLAIPDNDAIGIYDSRRITADGNLLDLDVAITVTHPWVGDLVISLEHVETGRRVLLYDRPGVPASPAGCSGSDLLLILDDDAALTVEDSCQATTPAYPLGITYRPNEPLSNFTDIPFSGMWKLHVSDLASSDAGTLNRWCLDAALQPAPELTFAHTSFDVIDAPAIAPVTVTLNRPAALTVTVDYATVGGSAIAGVHYITTTGTLTLTPGATDQQFTVPIITMPVSATQTVTLALSHPVNASLSHPDETTLRLMVLPYRLYLPVSIILSPS